MKWIDYKKEKPSIETPVLITQYKSMKIELGRYCMVAVMDASFTWYDEWHRDAALYNPTHWMPLPKIPQN